MIISVGRAAAGAQGPVGAVSVLTPVSTILSEWRELRTIPERGKIAFEYVSEIELPKTVKQVAREY